jgi:hypothetical protein
VVAIKFHSQQYLIDSDARAFQFQFSTGFEIFRELYKVGVQPFAPNYIGIVLALD